MSSDPELLERLRKARSRAQNLVSTYSTDKPLQRTAEQVDDASRRLATSKIISKAASTQYGSGAASSSNTYNTNKLERLRHAISLKQGFEPLDRLAEADVDGFLKHQRKLILLTAIEEAKAGTSDTYLNVFSRAMERDWQAARKDLQQALTTNAAYGSSQQVMDASRVWNGTADGSAAAAAESASNAGVPSQVVRPSRRELRFLEAITRWAAASRKGDRAAPSLVAQLCAAAEEMRGAEEGQSAEEAAHMWRLLNALALAPASESARLEAAQTFLSEQYLDLIAAGPRSNVALAGAPGLLPLVQRHVAQRHAHTAGELDAQGCPVWAVLYFLLRCGGDAVAVDYAQQCGIGDVRAAASSGGVASGGGGTPDFRLAVAALHGGGEAVGRDSGAFRTTEDYLWLRLRLVRARVQPLAALQATVHKYSSGFRERPALMALMHLLTLEPASAVAALLLLPSHALYVDGVHMALALQHCGMAESVPDAAARYVASRVLPWDPAAALDCCRAAPTPSLLQPVLLGCVSPPALSALLRSLPDAVADPAARADLLQRCGRLCSDSGRPADACALFEAAAQWDAVLVVLLTHCARLVTLRAPHAHPVMALARQYAARWTHSGQWRAMHDQRAVEAFQHLMALADFFAAYHEGNFVAALDVARRSLPMLPLGQSHDACMRVVETLHASVVGVLPELLLAAMTILAKLHAAEAGNGGGGGGGGALEAQRTYKRQSQDLLAFAGLQQHRLSSDVFARLIATASTTT